MKASNIILAKALSAALLVASTPTYAEIYFQANGDGASFEYNAANAGNVFQLPPAYADNLEPGSFFEVTDAASWGGSNSLRFNYGGNNGICNTCGTYLQLRHVEGFDGANSFTVLGKFNPDWRNGDPLEERFPTADSTQLDDPDTPKADDGPRATKGRVLYNFTNGKSKWIITDIVNERGTNDRLNVSLVAPPIDGSTPQFMAGDQIRLARRCGIDGSVGGNQPTRMSDCDGAITWFTTESTIDRMWAQDERDPLYRRVYLKHELNNPSVHTKLRYMEFGRYPQDYNSDMNIDRADYDYKAPGATLPAVSKRTIVVYAETLPDLDPPGRLRPVVTGMRKLHPDHWNNNNIPGIPIDTVHKTRFSNSSTPANMEDRFMDRGKWYYMEERIVFSSDDDTADGSYTIWLNEAGSGPTNCDDTAGVPMFQQTGLIIPPLGRTSMWGNHQTNEQRVGSFYMDDIVISNVCNGDTVAQGANPKDAVKPPAAPTP